MRQQKQKEERRAGPDDDQNIHGCCAVPQRLPRKATKMVFDVKWDEEG